MKRWKKFLAGVLAMAMMLSCLPGLGLEVKADYKYGVSGDFKYYIKSNSYAVIDKYTGKDKDVVIPSKIKGKKVKEIGEGAFWNCSRLTSVELPSGVTYIGQYAFKGCRSLTSVKIPDSMKTIDWWAFEDCSSLKSIKIPDGVTGLGINPFGGCSSLKSITIPASVVEMDDNPIGGNIVPYCRSLESIKVAAGNPKYDSRNNCNAIIETKSNILLAGCSSTKIPKSVKEIYSRAFAGCSGLTSIEIPSKVTRIDGYAFYDCSKLKSITIPSSVTEIGNYAVGWAQSKTTGQPVKKSNFVIYGKRGSEAERYAKENGFTFRLSSGKVSISKASVTLSKTRYTYDGKAKKPSVTVKLNGKKLSANKDYTVSYSNNTKAGTAKVTVTGKGNYTGKKSVTFKIVKAADSKITCKKTVYKVAYDAKPFKINATSKSKMTFTSSEPKIAAVGKNTGKVTVKNTGVAIITIKAGNTTKKVTIKVSPKKPSVKTAKAAEGKKLTVSWAKDQMASGYQVQISTDENFEKNVKSKSLSKTSYTFTELETGKKYYIRIRSYKKSGKETLYSAWSKAKLSGKIEK